MLTSAWGPGALPALENLTGNSASRQLCPACQSISAQACRDFAAPPKDRAVLPTGPVAVGRTRAVLTGGTDCAVLRSWPASWCWGRLTLLRSVLLVKRTRLQARSQGKHPSLNC